MSFFCQVLQAFPLLGVLGDAEHALASLVDHALAIGMTSVECALVFLLRCAAFSCWTLRPDVMGPWCWGPG